MTPIRVLLVEDHETVRQGLKLLIDAQDDMEVVGEAANGVAALQRARELEPDVVVMDISMPEMNGVAATRELRAAKQDRAIVALTRYADDAYVQEMLGAGASAYVLKQSASTELLRAVRAAVKGDRYIDSSVANTGGLYGGRQARGATYQPRLSDRETAVLRMMARGHSNKEIASELDISVKTVEVHKANAMRKVGLHGRIDVVRFALLKGWLNEA